MNRPKDLNKVIYKSEKKAHNCFAPNAVVPETTFLKSISITTFFEAWPVPRSVIAEKLRNRGVKISMNQIKNALCKKEEFLTESERQLLILSIQAIQSDMMKVRA